MSSADEVNLPDQPTPNRKRLGILDYLGIFFGLTTVVGFVLAYYWHGQSVQARLPTYYVSSERTRIVDTSIAAPSQLQVLYKGRSLGADVNAVTVYLWNDGNLPIKRDDVLDPIRIQLETGSEILDAQIMKVSRSLTGFSKGEISENARNLLPLSFGILEHGDGAALQVIYAGKPSATVEVAGAVVGASQFRSLASVPHSQKDRREELALVSAFWLATAVMLIAEVVIILARKGKVMTVPRRKQIAFVAASTVIYLTLSMFITHSYHKKFQPVAPQSIWYER